jgi:hypothetical protein
MSRKFQYVPLDRIISKLYRDLGLEEISETDIIEWTSEALEGIGAIALYEEAITFSIVQNHQCGIPCGLHSILQIARDVSPPKNCDIKAVYNEFIGAIPPQPDTSDIFDCSTFMLPKEEDYYRPFYDLQEEFSGGGVKPRIPKFIPIRLTNHTFFNTVVLPEDLNLYNSSGNNEYNIVQDKLIFSFKEGIVAIAYHRPMIDKETGYPLIPDDYSITTAITMYITMKYMARLWYLGREGYADKFQKAEQDWHWYCKQAGNALLAPFGEDEFENILQGRKQMIPKGSSSYYGFFGNLGKDTTVGWSRGVGQGGNHLTNRR